MTDATSILDFDFDDSKFQQFFDKFEKHRESAGKLPGAWSAITKGQEKSLAVLGLIGDQLGVINKSILSVVDATKKSADNQEKFARSAHAGALSIEGTARHALSLSRSLADGAISMLKIGSIAGVVGGLLGAGGLWGIDRLAEAAGGARRSAMGLGVSSAEQQAFSINYGRVVDSPSGLLETVANAKSDVREAAPLLALGIRDYANRGTADLAQDVLDRIRTQARKIDPRMLGTAADAYGWTKFESLDEIRRSIATPDDEWARLRERTARDRQDLTVDPKTQEAWQTFTAQLYRAGQTIENTLVTGLAPLAVPLGHLSDAVSHVLAAFVKAAADDGWIDTLTSALDRFAKFIGTKEFSDDVKSFVQGIGAAGKAIVSFVEMLGGSSSPDDKTPLPGGGPSYEETHPDETATGKMVRHIWQNYWTHQDSSMNEWLRSGHAPPLMKYDDAPLDYARKYFQSQGMSDAGAAGLVGALFADSKLDPNAFNPAGGGRGAIGIAGWRGSRIDDFQRLFGHSLKGAPLDEQLAFAEWELTHTEKSSGDIARRATSATNAAAQLVHSFLRPGPDEGAESLRAQLAAGGHYGIQPRFMHAPSPTKLQSPAPVSVQLHITNQTGANAAVLAAAAGVS